GDHRKLEVAGAAAAVGFRDRDAKEAEFGKALPQLLVVGGLAFQHLAHRLRRALLGEKAPRLIAQLFLVFGEIEIHGASASRYFLTLSLRMYCSENRCPL